MTSTMRFDKWENSLGQPYNAVLQVKTSQLTARNAQSLGVFATGSPFLSVTISPKFASSLILVQFFVNGSSNDETRYTRFAVSTFRNSNQIGLGDVSGTGTRVTSSNWWQESDSAASSHLSGTVVDSPNTTSAVTYDIRPVNIRGDSGNIIYINGPARTDQWAIRGISTLVVTEIAQ